MIYDGPILDPRLRYYIRPTQPVEQYFNSPRSIDRFAKYKAQPVNYNNMAMTPQNLSNSKIYTKQGLLKRNDMGWDGVKLTEYVTQQLSQNYLQNQKILQKFRKQAEENRKIKKYGHAYENRVSATNSNQIKNYLPPILPVSHQINTNRYSPVSYSPALEQSSINEQEQIPHFRNVGVNTHHNYQKSQLQKYITLLNKYETMKQKYEREKQLRKIQKRRYRKNQEEKQRQMASIQKIKDIQHQLMNISVKLQASNEFIAQKINAESRKKPIQSNKGSPRRLKTQPELPQKEDYRLSEDNSFAQIPLNPLLKLKNREIQKTKQPTVLYTKKNRNDEQQFVTKYSRKL